jgi:hypothetical protein
MYKVIGVDQKEYGPIDKDQLLQWIREGRVNAQTLARWDEGPWKPLAEHPELASLFARDPGHAAPPAAGAFPASTGLQTNPMAVTGLVFSILGVICCGPIGATLGLVFSLIGLSQINQNPHQYSGKNIAVAGIVLAVVGYLLFAIQLVTGGFRRIFDFRW